jgi:hypothetical protein
MAEDRWARLGWVALGVMVFIVVWTLTHAHNSGVFDP